MVLYWRAGSIKSQKDTGITKLSACDDKVLIDLIVLGEILGKVAIRGFAKDFLLASIE